MGKSATNGTGRSKTIIETMQSKIDALTKRNFELESQISAHSKLEDSKHPLNDAISSKTDLSAADIQKLLDISPLPMLITSSVDGNIIVANKQLCRAINLDQENIIGRNNREFYTDLNDLKSAAKMLDLTGEILQKKIKFGLKGKEKFDTILASKKITYQGQDAVLSAITNTTDQQNMYRSLQENEARYRLLVENAPEAIILFDLKERQCVDTNRSASELLGYSTPFLQQIESDNLYPELQKDDVTSRQLCRRYVRQALSGKVPTFEWQLIDRQGHQLLCEVRLVAYTLSEKKYIQCSIIEIGEKRKLEVQIQRNQRLQVLGRLAGGIAHDFNNILAIILGHTELLIDKLSGSSDSTDRLLNRILTSSERGAELTQKLLAYSRNQPLLPECVQTNAKLKEIGSILTSQVGAQVKVDLKLGDDTWDCLADPARLEGAILNLCLNARDSMPEGGKLTIETSNADLDDEYVTAQLDLVAGQYVQISISDTGEGISRENIDHVFDPFFTTEDFGQRSGMGLSMVFGFVKQSSGHVSIYSEVGHGTVARIYLPRYVPKITAASNIKSEIPIAERQTVLLVEDNPDIRLLALNLLQTMNYRVLEAKNADTALQIMQQNPRLNLLLTDYVLEGGMNGEELAKKARKISNGLPVLLMTGYTKDFISSQTKLDDSTVILQKPFRKADLSEKILEAKSLAHISFNQG
ncbi:MAG: PAS domain S-box protein [Sneathiella sp.]|nr:PAS domain S-box protein [Sneathiella sp.]